MKEDFHVPTKEELTTLIDSGAPFIKPSYYWSSTSHAGSPFLAWGVDFDGGYVYADYKDDELYVRCVRSRQSRTFQEITENRFVEKDDCWLDRLTGLEWAKDEKQITWHEAMQEEP